MNTTLHLITALVVLSSLAPACADEAKPQETAQPAEVKEPIVRGISTEPFSIGDSDEPEEMQLVAFSKHFCVALRRLDNDESKLAALRVFFDPRYLEKHELKEGAFPVKTVAVGDIINIQIANDRRTVICEVETDENPKELLLLRLTVHDGKLYLTPIASPDPETRSFTPWIYRRKLE